MDNFMFKNGLMTQGVYSEQFKYENVIGDLGTLMRSGTSLAILNDPTAQYVSNTIDMLDYDYQNGQLKAVNEGQGGDAQRGFRNNATYDYDDNGNLIEDTGKDLDFEYNIINLPQKIIGAGGTMTNIYAFSGEKVLSKGPQGVRKYLGGMEYLDEKPQHYAHSEGRIQYAEAADPELGEIQYKITDHLGNMMVLFGDKDGDRKINTETAVAADNSLPLEIVQRHFYYAYGMEMEGPWQHTPPVGDAYRYNGKELVGDLGMGLMDYGARWYDGVIGRWTGVDPLAEKYYAWSPYNYVLGNPISMIDPMGMNGEKANDHIFVNRKGEEVGRIVDPTVKLVSVVDDNGWHPPMAARSISELKANSVGTWELGKVEDMANRAMSAPPLESNSENGWISDSKGRIRNDVRRELSQPFVEIEPNVYSIGGADSDRPGDWQTSPSPDSHKGEMQGAHIHPNEMVKGIIRSGNGIESVKGRGPSSRDYVRWGVPVTGSNYYDVMMDDKDVYFYQDSKKTTFKISRSSL